MEIHPLHYNCPACTFGCNIQDDWVDHLLSMDHRAKQLDVLLWNWPIGKNRRALVYPLIPSVKSSNTTTGSRYQRDVNGDVENADAAHDEFIKYHKKALQHFYSTATIDINDLYFDFNWKVAVLLLRDWKSAQMLHEKSKSNPFLGIDLLIKSNYFLDNEKFKTLEKLQLSQPGTEETPEKMALFHITQTLKVIKKTPLSLDQSLSYLLESFSLTKPDKDLQEGVFNQLKELLQSKFPQSNISLVCGSDTHFGYKFSGMEVDFQMLMITDNHTTLDSVAEEIKNTVEKSSAFSVEFTGSKANVYDPLSSLKFVKVRHNDLKILIQLKIYFGDGDPFGPRLISFLLNFDKRAICLTNLILLWNSFYCVELHDNHLIQLIAVFLMKKKYIPNINLCQDLVAAKDRIIIGKWDHSVCMDVNKINTEFNKRRTTSSFTNNGIEIDAKEILLLANQFFHFYSTHLEHSVVCLLIGDLIKRDAFLLGKESILPLEISRKYHWTRKHYPRDSHQRLRVYSDSNLLIPMIIQHPFKLNTNLTSAVSLMKTKAFQAACWKCRTTFQNMKQQILKPHGILFFFSHKEPIIQNKDNENQTEMASSSMGTIDCSELSPSDDYEDGEVISENENDDEIMPKNKKIKLSKEIRKEKKREKIFKEYEKVQPIKVRKDIFDTPPVSPYIEVQDAENNDDLDSYQLSIVDDDFDNNSEESEDIQIVEIITKNQAELSNGRKIASESLQIPMPKQNSPRKKKNKQINYTSTSSSMLSPSKSPPFVENNQIISSIKMSPLTIQKSPTLIINPNQNPIQEIHSPSSSKFNRIPPLLFVPQQTKMSNSILTFQKQQIAKQHQNWFDISQQHFLNPLLTEGINFCSTAKDAKMKGKNLWLKFMKDFFILIWSTGFGFQIIEIHEQEIDPSEISIVFQPESNKKKDYLQISPPKRSRIETDTSKSKIDPIWILKWEKLSLEEERFHIKCKMKCKTIDFPFSEEIKTKIIDELLKRIDVLSQFVNKDKDFEFEMICEVKIHTSERKIASRRGNHNSYFSLSTNETGDTEMDMSNRELMREISKSLQSFIPRYAKRRLDIWMSSVD